MPNAAPRGMDGGGAAAEVSRTGEEAAMRWQWIVSLSVLVACGGQSPDGDTAARNSAAPAGAAPSPMSQSPGQSRNACRLLTPDELKALEPSVVLGNVVAQEPEFSECNWEDENGIVLLGLKVYWSGGRQQWEIWRRAQGLGERMFQRAEGIGLDSVVQQGLVPGLGDSAYFSPLLPSLLLKGDVLVEIMMPTVERPEAKFRPLATTLLGRI
jgi:hypothetical protein